MYIIQLFEPMPVRDGEPGPAVWRDVSIHSNEGDANTQLTRFLDSGVSEELVRLKPEPEEEQP